MPVPIHDVTASTANLARAWLQSIDRSALETPVPTATLILWLETLIGLAEPRSASDIGSGAQRTVMGHMSEINQAHDAEIEEQIARSAVLR